ncbi:unnamed protein product [Arctia plantaginis]|uniref:Lipase domain-containing protein n=1 Tax=Arctia plantaginis TaxID=874455 RepID=A0A8S1A214_ARCPL|nr:unnamed protein product [Arctia plantaginis]
MKLLVVLAAVTALCAGSAIPVVPGDNSHYVEGESRYIWMPDSEGIPQLIDLHEPAQDDLVQARSGANNAYWLFTRQNRNNHQVLTHGNINSIRQSNYMSNRPLKVIVHGFISSGNSDINPLLTSAFLDNQDCNVIVVDWSRGARPTYTSAVRIVPSVGQFLGNFLVWLINNAGGNWNNVHLVGFSLGAHVVGLDPAGPQWGLNAVALNRNDGQYVEAIHTNGGRYGIFDRSADADFYPNGGRLSAGGAIPVVPGNYSHYVEGESRYIWMPDDEGILHLEDLHEPAQEDLVQARNGANNAYWLFTRQNRNNHEVLTHGNINSVRQSNYMSNRPLKVIVHGFNIHGFISSGNSDINPLLTSAFLDNQDCNVIVVDWRNVARPTYSSAVRGVPSVGQFLGNFLVWLINNAGGNWNNVHLVGFSLGAHVVGLDPAGPQWGGNSLALNRNDGQYVESHTIVYTADLTAADCTTKATYAGDTVIYSTYSDPKMITLTQQKHLNDFEIWLKW